MSYYYDISEYRNMSIPEELKCLMGKISRDEMLQKITMQNVKDTDMAMIHKPVTFAKRVAR